MNKPWEVIEFVPYLRSRWRIPAIACATALTLTLAISLLLTKRYTAKVVISIDPPAGNDVRMATSVSPVYLESLKGYERIAASDSLFAKAVENFHLKAENPSEPIEGLKRRVLKISKIRETRILEINATLPNPQVAHELAQYIAEQTVAMNQKQNAAADHDRADRVKVQLAEARERLNKNSRDSTGSAKSGVEALQSRNDADSDLLVKLRQELADSEADAAEYSSNTGNATEGERASAARARAGALRAAVAQLEHEIAANQSMIEAAGSRRELAETEANIAQSEYTAVSNRLLDLEAAVGTDGERLRIIDPGIVPQRPSFPNIPFSIALAIAVSAAASVTYIAIAFSYERRRMHDALFR